MLSPIIIVIINFGLSHYGLVIVTPTQEASVGMYMYNGCDYLVCVCTF